MPSDAKKREQQRKKEQAKARAAGKKGGAVKNDDSKEQSPAPDSVTNGSGVTTNGTSELSAEGTFKFSFYTGSNFLYKYIFKNRNFSICVF